MRRLIAALLAALTILGLAGAPAHAAPRRTPTVEVVETSCSATVTGRAGDLLYTDFIYRVRGDRRYLVMIFTDTQWPDPVGLVIRATDPSGEVVWAEMVSDTDYLWHVPPRLRGRGDLTWTVSFLEARYGRTSSTLAGDRPPGHQYAACEAR